MVASRDWPGSRRTSTKRRASCSSVVVVVVVVVDVATVSVTVSKSSCSSARRTGNTWRRWRTNCGRWPSTATSRSRLTSRWRSCWSTTCTTRRPRCDHTVHASTCHATLRSVLQLHDQDRDQDHRVQTWGPIYKISYDSLTIILR